ncbi:MAG: YkvA family protein [Chitinophagales bacterium]
MYNGMHSSENGTWIKQVLGLIPNFLRMLYGLLLDRRVSLTEKLLLFGTITYVISPLDFLPDFIPFAGQVDDMLLVSLVTLRFIHKAGYKAVTEHWSGDKDIKGIVSKFIRLAEFVLPHPVYNWIVLGSRFKGRTIDIEYEVK